MLVPLLSLAGASIWGESLLLRIPTEAHLGAGLAAWVSPGTLGRGLLVTGGKRVLSLNLHYTQLVRDAVQFAPLNSEFLLVLSPVLGTCAIGSPTPPDRPQPCVQCARLQGGSRCWDPRVQSGPSCSAGAGWGAKKSLGTDSSPRPQRVYAARGDSWRIQSKSRLQLLPVLPPLLKMLVSTDFSISRRCKRTTPVS
jgi:hypothetical protein